LRTIIGRNNHNREYPNEKITILRLSAADVQRMRNVQALVKPDKEADVAGSLRCGRMILVCTNINCKKMSRWWMFLYKPLIRTLVIYSLKTWILQNLRKTGRVI
jgi:hypothetical protein